MNNPNYTPNRTPNHHFDKFFSLPREGQEKVLVSLLECTTNHFDTFETYREREEAKILLIDAADLLGYIGTNLVSGESTDDDETLKDIGENVSKIRANLKRNQV